LQQVELQLERHLRLEVHRPPRFDRLAQDVARIPRDRLAVVFEVGDADHGVVLPTRPQRAVVEHRVDVVQAHVELRPGDGKDLAVVAQRVHTDAERGPAQGHQVSEEVLAAFDAVQVRIQEAQPLARRVHVRPVASPARARPKSRTVGFAESIALDDLERDPYPLYARLRDDEPVAWVPAVQLWLVTRWDDVRTVDLTPELFTAATDPSTLNRTMGTNMLGSE